MSAVSDFKSFREISAYTIPIASPTATRAGNGNIPILLIELDHQSKGSSMGLTRKRSTSGGVVGVHGRHPGKKAAGGAIIRLWRSASHAQISPLRLRISYGSPRNRCESAQS